MAKFSLQRKAEGHRVEHLMTLSDTQLSLRLLAQLLDEAFILVPVFRLRIPHYSNLYIYVYTPFANVI